MPMVPSPARCGADRHRARPVQPPVAALAAVFLLPAACLAQPTAAGIAADVAAIRAAATAYREALAKGDRAAIRAAWTADGDIVDGWGNRLKPQDATALDGGTAPGKPRPEFRVNDTQLRFITTDVALEDGTVDVVLPGTKTPLEGWFSAVWVRTGGGWKLAGLREAERPMAADADTLEDLDWMVGEWSLVVEAEKDATPTADAAPEMIVRWDAGRTFLVRELRIPAPDADGPVEVHQRIGWDPLVRRIRSWSFSSDGSRGEATWFRDGESWVAVHTAVLPDGSQDTTINISTPEDADRFLWRTLPDALEADAGGPTRATWVRKGKGAGR